MMGRTLGFPLHTIFLHGQKYEIECRYLQSRQDLLPDERMVGPGITKALLNKITVYVFIFVN
jgi:hypothetical protein